MNLYHGGYGRYQGFTVAENEEEAINKLGKELNISFLPVTAKEVEVDGYVLEVISATVEAAPRQKADKPPAKKSAKKSSSKTKTPAKKEIVVPEVVEEVQNGQDGDGAVPEVETVSEGEGTDRPAGGQD